MVNIYRLDDPRLNGVDRLYVVGDIHGRLDLLLELEQRIGDDMAGDPESSGAICYLGDYVDRGPASFGVVEYLASRADLDVPRIFLKGNHEDRLLAFLEAPERNGPSWMRFGGREALTSYGVSVPEDEAEVDWPGIRTAFRQALPDRHARFYRQLRAGLLWRGHLMVHAGVHPERPLDDQDEHDLMWVREPFLSAAKDYGVRVVHGHTVRAEVEYFAHRIGIDTGAYESGKLSALRIGPDGSRQLHTGGADPEHAPAPVEGLPTMP